MSDYLKARADKSARVFTCEICNKQYPMTARDIHHRIPQACGGSDEQFNLCYCDEGCHQTVHRIGLLLASTKAGKQSPEEEAQLFARAANEAIWMRVRDNVLQLAVQVAVAESARRNGEIAVGDADIVIPNFPPRLRKILIELGKTVKSENGRAVGMVGIVTAAVIKDLVERRPEMRDEAFAYLHERYGMTSKQQKQVEQARRVMDTHGIQLVRHK